MDFEGSSLEQVLCIDAVDAKRVKNMPVATLLD